MSKTASRASAAVAFSLSHITRAISVTFSPGLTSTGLDDDGLIEITEFGQTDFDSTWYGDWDLNDDDFVDSGEFYDGFFGAYDADEDGHWDNAEWDDAGEVGLFDV